MQQIETERLVLHNFKEEDLNDLYQILSNKDVMEYSEDPYDYLKMEQFLHTFCMKKRDGLEAVKKDVHVVIGYLLFHEISEEVIEIGCFFSSIILETRLCI